MEKNFFTRYCGAYLASYILMTSVIMLLIYTTSINIPNAMNVVIAMVSAYYPAALFVKDHNRVPNKSEKRKFAFLSLLAITILTSILGIIIIKFTFTPEEYKELIDTLYILPGWAMLLIAFFIAFLYYVVIAWGFGRMAKTQLKLLKKDEQI